MYECGFEITDTKLSSNNLSEMTDAVVIVTPSPTPPALLEIHMVFDESVLHGLEKIAHKSEREEDGSKETKNDENAAAEQASKRQVTNE